MAIFGNLTEFPFLEVISMLQSRTGVLRFSNLRPYESVELQLQTGQLRGLTVDGVPIFDVGMARSYLLEISEKRVGDFEFRKTSDLTTRQSPLSIVVKDALLRSDVARSPIPDMHLPDPQTRFAPAAADTAQMSDDLKRFWVSAHSLLLNGSSAEQIARALRLELRAVQVMLYQLRTIGAIRPARRIEETMPIKPPAVTSASQSAPSQSVSAPFSPELFSPKPLPPKPSLISRLLGALSFARRAS